MFHNKALAFIVSFFLTCSIVFSLRQESFGQGSWTQKTNFGGLTRQAAVGFSIGTKGYIGTGTNGNGTNAQRDFWEWDQPTNTWTQKANFGGSARRAAVGFSIGNKGYIGTGGGAAGSTADFWEYDPVANTWTAKANCGGPGRFFATGFSIGTKGYIGTGFGFVFPPGSPILKDFWEWDQATNAWTQKAAFGGAARNSSVGFSIGSNGYIGLGYDGSSAYFNDFWKWNQATNTWTQIANFPGGPRPEATAFTIGNYGYAGTGTRQIGNIPESDFWRYNPATNSWNAIPNFGGGQRELACSFSIGCYGYVATGYWTDGGNTTNDMWEYYDPTDTTCGCKVLASVNGSTTICAGQNTTLSASGGTNYTWSTGNTMQTISVSPASTTTYSVIVSGVSCADTAFVTVTVAPPPVAVVSAGSTICAGQSATLSASGGSTYAWSNGASTASINVVPAVTTTYSVIVSVGLCADTNWATITVSPSPAPVVTGPVFICIGDMTTLTASGGSTYAWSTGANTNVITVNPSSTTSYTVTATNANGCTNETAVTVTVSPPPIAAALGTTVCAGLPALLNASGGSNYVWSNGATSSVVSVTPAVTTTFSVIVSIGSCTDTANATVVVNPAPVAAAFTNTTISAGSSVTLNATGGGSYSWSPVTGLSDPAVANPVASPLVTTQYCVTVTDANGCTDRACVIVTVENPCPQNMVLVLPNAFSPNGDGENDEFCLQGGLPAGQAGISYCLKDLKLVIYDRWGEMIYSASGVESFCWDGRYKNKIQNAAVFVYYLEATPLSGEKIMKKGNVSLVR